MRGVHPQSYDYDDQALLSHFSQAGFSSLLQYLKKGLDENGNPITKEHVKTNYIQRLAVKEKTIALDALKRGLTLDGKAPT